MLIIINNNNNRLPPSQCHLPPFLLLLLFLNEIGPLLVVSSACTFSPEKGGISASIESIENPSGFATSSFSSSPFFSMLFNSDGHPHLPAHHSPDDLFSLPQCACEPDWARAFCARMAEYAEMGADKAPSVCICRQLTGTRQCRQFLSRCFRHSSTTDDRPQQFHAHPQHRPVVKRPEKCGCCFNQPDQFCTQLECHQMQPQFGPMANTSCRCFVPAREGGEGVAGNYAPGGLCDEFSQHWLRDIDDSGGMIQFPSSSAATKSSSPPSPPPLHAHSRSSLAHFFRSFPYAPFASLLLLALLASLLLAVAICFWSHWRRIRQGRRKAKVEAEQQQQPMVPSAAMDGGEGEEEEERGRRQTIIAENSQGPLLQEATV